MTPAPPEGPAPAPARLDVLGIGNAIVDVLAHADDGDIARLGLEKGSMMLVDAERSGEIYASLGPAVEASGGSAANTVAGVASFGGSAGFVGRVRDDQLGEVFAHDIRAIGVEYATPSAPDGPPTARCLILVTPDAQRTMNTYLGASQHLRPDDVDLQQVADASVTYLEGYLWDPPEAKDAFRVAMDAAHRAGRRVAFTLSDSFCVGRFRSEFLELAEHDVDVVFANEAEITALYECDFDEAVDRVRDQCELAALTRSERGSLVVHQHHTHEVPIRPHGEVVDTTGAGDQYAAGFLFGLTHGLEPEACGHLGSLAAGEVIAHVGARPESSLLELARSAGLL